MKRLGFGQGTSFWSSRSEFLAEGGKNLCSITVVSECFPGTKARNNKHSLFLPVQPVGGLPYLVHSVCLWVYMDVFEKILQEN